MPSGLHGGGHGHWGGGASGGHHHSSGGGYHSGGSFHWVFPATFMLFGRRHHISENKRPLYSLVSFFIVLFVFVALFSGVVWWATSGEIDKIKVDYEYYQDMIDRAEDNPSTLIKTARVISHMYDEDCGKWYYIYTIPKDAWTYPEDEYLTGNTYSIYTREEINAIPVGTYVQVAVNDEEVKKTTDSVPLDYKDIPLEKDGRYVVSTRTFKISRGVCIGSIGGAVLLIVVLIVMVSKARETEDVPADTIPSQDNPRESGNSFPTKCPYCGSRLDRNDVHCPDCGATVRQ